eukprot:TRINITY_DN18240_c0_g2_i1.p1 TRINITY_DN18240_c0_g2~~TRINITY_DN18240_c0_g2_i1.p1  ORF type:complete len:451 (-),score=97.02 TRINITY_DN18240_c0_g2_i1:366-1718(-)
MQARAPLRDISNSPLISETLRADRCSLSTGCAKDNRKNSVTLREKLAPPSMDHDSTDDICRRMATLSLKSKPQLVEEQCIQRAVSDTPGTVASVRKALNTALNAEASREREAAAERALEAAFVDATEVAKATSKEDRAEKHVPAEEQQAGVNGCPNMEDAAEQPVACEEKVAAAPAKEDSGTQRSVYARLLDDMRHQPGEEKRLHAAVADYVDEVLKTLFAQSERAAKLPREKGVEMDEAWRKVTGTTREDTLFWICQACMLLSLPENILAMVMQMLDRYMAKQAAEAVEPMTPNSTRTLVFACVSVTLKTAFRRDREATSLKYVLETLSEKQVPLESIYRMETHLLEILDFDFLTPIAYDMLEVRIPRFHALNIPQAGVNLAKMLLQLVLAYPSIYWRHDHVTLVNACIVVMLTLLSMPPQRHVIEGLVADTAAHQWLGTAVPRLGAPG